MCSYERGTPVGPTGVEIARERSVSGLEVRVWGSGVRVEGVQEWKVAGRASLSGVEGWGGRGGGDFLSLGVEGRGGGPRPLDVSDACSATQKLFAGRQRDPAVVRTWHM